MQPDIIQANIEVHRRMADSYATTEPHFRPENQSKVRGILTELRARCGGGRLVDLGCGTGFILQLAKDLFTELHGVDVTQAMLDKVDRSSGNIFLHNAPVEQLPLPDAAFDLVTSYSFIHHVRDYRAVLREAHRVLRPGGLVYIDLEPNRLFWERLSALPPDASHSPLLRQARIGVTETDIKVQEQYGIPKELFNLAEYGKAILGGVDRAELHEASRALGFSACESQYEWYLGQGEVMHGQSFEAAAVVERYLRSIAPLSDHLFKYVRFILTK